MRRAKGGILGMQIANPVLKKMTEKYKQNIWLQICFVAVALCLLW